VTEPPAAGDGGQANPVRHTHPCILFYSVQHTRVISDPWRAIVPAPP